MGITALIAAIILYCIVATDLAIKKDYAMSMVFGCYALSNVGFIWKMYQ